MSVIVFAQGNVSGIWVWTWRPSIMIGLAVLVGLYFWATAAPGRRWGLAPVSLGRKASFYLGTLLVFLALVSPIDHLADEYLFSAHMLQHMLLMMIAPPLWLIGLPDGLVDKIVPRRLIGAARLLSKPVVAFAIYNGVLWIWHIPNLYDAALASEDMHIVEHLIFIAAGVIAWWPMLGKSKKAAPSASPAVQMIYLFLMMFPMTLLAALLTFARYPVYPFYASAPRLWGLSVMDDQQAGGLLMWIPGNMIYFIPFAFAFFRWFEKQDRDEDVRYPPEPEGSSAPVGSRRSTARIKS